MEIDEIFENRKIIPERLLSFGFVRQNEGYSYAAPLLDGRFQMSVIISEQGKVFTEVIDTISEYAYVLHRVADAEGEFVGRVRDEYECVLATINNACFERDVFKSSMTKEVISHVRETYGDELEFLWNRFPENAVFRRQDTAKWYAALLRIPKRKLGIDDDELIEIIDLRIISEEISSLIDNKKYFPGYHMNKKHWFTICLDGSVSAEEIFSRIEESYQLAKK
ncbi:hypothetical protein McpCs1_04810 [Methanocorpusculaceae archaeon Cs1]|uniref:MmcQ family protein n=2 Tax=Methanorbis rubei TaxID=3028300 RepID=A0AAE4MGM6_9EURY|nr:hypothetical protein [Methanocorpusculaceae archaeon Cs1]